MTTVASGLWTSPALPLKKPTEEEADFSGQRITWFIRELRNTVVYGEIWERPQLSKRDRSLITVAVLQAMYRTSELRTHIGRALDQNGVTPQEVSEVILHVTFYAGWPAAVNAGRLAAEAFEERGVELSELE